MYMDYFKKTQMITTIHNIFMANPKTIITIMYKIFSTKQSIVNINTKLFSKSSTYKINKK